MFLPLLTFLVQLLHWCFHSTMADNTRLKKLSINMSRVLEMLEADRKDNKARFESLEVMVESLLKQNSGSGKNHNLPHPPFQVSNVKLNFPCFNGSEVLQWIFKAEQFFDYYNTPYPQRLKIATIHMEKELVPWFQMTNRATLFQSWIEFTHALVLEFGLSPYECTRSLLFKLSQLGFVHDYYTQFTALVNRV